MVRPVPSPGSKLQSPGGPLGAPHPWNKRVSRAISKMKADLDWTGMSAENFSYPWIGGLGYNRQRELSGYDDGADETERFGEMHD